MPELYMKGFARQQRKSWFSTVVIKATGERRGPTNIKNLFVERDYNTIVDTHGNPDYRVEQLLADHVEATSAAGFQALRAAELPLSNESKAQMAIFMSAQLGRGRGLRQSFRRGLTEVMGLALRMSAASASDEQFEQVLGHPLSAAERERLMNNLDHIVVEPSNGTLLEMALSSVSEIAEMLLKRTWTLLVFPEACLLSGEHPVVHVNPSGETTGYGVVTAERLYMPVSTTVALFLSHPWAGWDEEVVRDSGDFARRLNWAMITHPANRELLLHPDVRYYPLPSIAELRSNTHWPWGPDPASELPGSSPVLP